MANDYTFRHTDAANGQFVVKPYTANGPSTPSDPLNLYTNLLSGVSAVSADTSLALVGKGVVEYNVVQQNLIYLMENFAAATRPVHPSQGQIWYKNTAGADANFPTDPTTVGLYVWSGTAWNPVVVSGVGASDIDFAGFKGINVGDATNPQDAVNLQTGDLRYVNTNGDTMTGLLVLSADPVAALGAATKQYVDVVGAAVSTKVDIAGDTMTGPLVLAADPTNNLEAATKQYVDTTVNSQTLDDLADVVLTSPAATEVLTYNGSSWVNSPASGGGAADGVVSGGSVNATTGEITLTRTIGLPDIVIPGLSPVSHVHDGTDVTFDHTTAYPQSMLYPNAYGTANYPLDPLYNVTVLVDQALSNLMRPVHRQLVVGAGGVAVTLAYDMEYTIGTNKLQVFKDGVKQYANIRGRHTISVAGSPVPGIATDTGLAVSTSYTINVTVDGVGPTTVTITTPATPGYPYLQLLYDIDAALTTATIPLSVNVEQLESRLDFRFDSQTTGAGSTVLVVDSGANPLFGSLASVIVTPRTPVAGVTYSYAEVGLPDEQSSQVNFTAAMTAGAVYEFLVSP